MCFPLFKKLYGATLKAKPIYIMDTIIEDPDVLEEESELLANSPQPDTGVGGPTKKNNESEADEDGGLMNLLASMNNNMQAMGESLKLLHKDRPSKTAEFARKRKACSSRDEGSSSESDDESDGERLLSKSGKKKKSNPEDDDPLLDEISQDLGETEEKISDKLANVINKHNKLSEEQLKEKSGKYYRPQNCELLMVPKVNPEIWGKLDRQTRGRDLKLSCLQTALTKVGNIAAQTTNLLLAARAEGSKLDIDNLVGWYEHRHD